MKDYRKAKKTVAVAVDESVRIMRELQELSRNALAQLTVPNRPFPEVRMAESIAGSQGQR